MTAGPTCPVFKLPSPPFKTIMFTKSSLKRHQVVTKVRASFIYPCGFLKMTTLKNLFQYFQMFNFSIVNADISGGCIKEFEDEADN